MKSFTETSSILLSSIDLNKSIVLKNRIVMAPMTRSFADSDLVPTLAMAEYYARRASAGLIITEGTIVRPNGQGYPNTPGIFNQAQIDGWKKVTGFVHKNGGKIFCQLWHVGRVSHPKYLNGEIPVAPSAVAIKGRIPRSGTKNPLEYGLPRELNTKEISEYKNSFIKGAINAVKAGFDGVEFHAAHGYLIDQFLHYDSNRRTDHYGGSPENMSRFLIEILKDTVSEIGHDKIGVRISPSAYFNMESDERDDHVFRYLLKKIDKLKVAYIHQGVIDESKRKKYLRNSTGEYLRKNYSGVLIGNNNYKIKNAANDIFNGSFDLISFGRLFISNPDLIDKIKNGLELNPYHSFMLKTLH